MYDGAGEGKFAATASVEIELPGGTMQTLFGPRRSCIMEAGWLC